VHFAAESHVDRSILGGADFVLTNVLGTQTLLQAALDTKLTKFVHVSTDEVYGSIETGSWDEQQPLEPNSPYSASKASSDLIARAYAKTHGVPVAITRCSNNYGPYQFPEKLIPLMIANALEGKKLPVYGDGRNVRDWIFVADHCEGIRAAMERGRAGEVYNFGGNAERENIAVVKEILRHVGKGEDLIQYVKDRPGHDRRYAMDSSKARATLGWEPRHSFEAGLRSTVDWYLQNRSWWQRVRSGAYLAYYEQQYGSR
jgi:dTDP-glucose 4,6-dehydratase